MIESVSIDHKVKLRDGGIAKTHYDNGNKYDFISADVLTINIL